MRAILFGGGLSLLIALLGTRVAINLFTKWGYGQEIRDDGPTSHHTVSYTHLTLPTILLV